MHIDPDVTDAYNGLISGHKWWLLLPKDFYEFLDELMCDPNCSDVSGRNTFMAAVWYHTVYPQLR